jgi:hypothetical protein
MASITAESRNDLLRVKVGELWSGDFGLTLVTLSVAALIFVFTPMREAGLSGRAVLDLIIVVLMLFGAITVVQNRVDAFLVVAFVTGSAVALGLGRWQPTPFLHQAGSVLSTITLLLYVRIVLLVIFRTGPITWKRVQGGVCTYLLLGMAWSSAFQIVEQARPGSFHFVTAPANFDQLISKLTYFSFCTLTTLGGNVSPTTPMARSLTIAEATVGQLFPAILISTLVAMAIQSKTKA